MEGGIKHAHEWKGDIYWIEFDFFLTNMSKHNKIQKSQKKEKLSSQKKKNTNYLLFQLPIPIPFNIRTILITEGSKRKEVLGAVVALLSAVFLARIRRRRSDIDILETFVIAILIFPDILIFFSLRKQKR